MEKLTNAEFEVINAVWKTTPPISTVRVMENINNKKDWKRTTVLTLLSRIAEKKYLSVKKSGRAHLYKVLVSKDKYRKIETQSFLDKMYNGSVENLIVDLYENNGISHEEIHDIIKILETKK